MGGERPLVVPEYNRGTKRAAVVCECGNPIPSLSFPSLHNPIFSIYALSRLDCASDSCEFVFGFWIPVNLNLTEISDFGFLPELSGNFPEFGSGAVSTCAAMSFTRRSFSRLPAQARLGSSASCQNHVAVARFLPVTRVH